MTSLSTEHHNWLVQIRCPLCASRFTWWLPPRPKTPMPSLQKYYMLSTFSLPLEFVRTQKFCQIPSKSSLWCCPKESQVWMPATGSVSVEGTSFWFLSGCKYKDFSSALCANTSTHLCTNTQAHVPKGKQTHISQHQFQPVPIIFQPFISCLVAFSTSALNCSSNTFWFHF